MSRRVVRNRLLRTVVCAAVHALLSVASASAQPSRVENSGNVRTVLTIHWSTEEFPSTPVVDAAIRETLLTHGTVPVDYFTEYLETDRFSPEEASESLRDYIQRKYRGRRIDAVIAVAEPALDFAIRYRAQLFPNAPIVASVVRMPAAGTRTAGPGITGVTQTTAYDRTLQLALRLHPSTERVFVIAQAPTLDYDGIRTELAAAAGNHPVTLIREVQLPRLLEAVRGIPERTVLLYIRYSREEPGHVIFPTEAAQILSDVSPVPVYGVTDAVIGTGVIGGVVTSRDRIGHRLAEMVQMILAGTPAQDIPIESLTLVPTFDWRQIERWHVDASLLPADSVIRFRTPTSWEQYRWYIVSAVSVVAVQAVLIASLLVQRVKRQRAELDSRRNLALAADASRRQTMSALTSSIAHELGQPLGSMIANAEALQMMITANRATSDTIGEILADIQTQGVQATQIIARLRTMLRSHQLNMRATDLHAVIEDGLALVDHEMKARQVEAAVNLSPHPCVISGDRVLLVQVLVNLVMNAMDAMADTPAVRRRVVIRTDVTAAEVALSVSDHGTGLAAPVNGTLFTPFVTTKAHGLGIGLTITRTIVEAHGGSIDARNNPEGGATFTVTLRS